MIALVLHWERLVWAIPLGLLGGAIYVSIELWLKGLW